MGACYKCGGEGWISRVTIVDYQADNLRLAPARSGTLHNLGQQFVRAPRQKLCPECKGKGVQVMQA